MDPRDVPPPPREVYAVMGEANIFAMLADFYDELGRSSIRSMFPPDLRTASEKSAAFFVTLLGGPPLFLERYGNPRMRARHAPFPIDYEARRVWLECFERILVNAPERYSFPAEHLDAFRRFLHGFSGWMVNTAPPDAIVPT